MGLVTEDQKSGFGNISVSEVIFSRDDVRFLSRDVEFSVKWDEKDEVFILFNEEFSMLISSSTLKGAMLEINDNICSLYDCYLSRDDDNLTGSAVVLKQKLSELFD